jgi:hypothetical protein
MMNIWQLAVRIVVVFASVGLVVLLVGVGVLWLVRWAGRNKLPR